MSGYCSDACHVSHRFYEQQKAETIILPIIKFKILNLAGPKDGSGLPPAIEVDVVEALKKMHPEGYNQALSYKYHISPFSKAK